MNVCRCGLPAVVQWRRRPTDAETAAIRAAEEARRATAARVGRTIPDVPLPTASDSAIAVYACADHALTPDSAALMHQAKCTGPGKTAACDCQPEPAPAPDPDPGKPKKRLPPGW